MREGPSHSRRASTNSSRSCPCRRSWLTPTVPTTPTNHRARAPTGGRRTGRRDARSTRTREAQCSAAMAVPVAALLPRPGTAWRPRCAAAMGRQRPAAAAAEQLRPVPAAGRRCRRRRRHHAGGRPHVRRPRAGRGGGARRTSAPGGRAPPLRGRARPRPHRWPTPAVTGGEVHRSRSVAGGDRLNGGHLPSDRSDATPLACVLPRHHDGLRRRLHEARRQRCLWCGRLLQKPAGLADCVPADAVGFETAP